MPSLQRWDESRFLAELDTYCSPEGATALRRLHSWATSHNASFPRSRASGPTLTAQLPAGSQPVSLWTMYLDFNYFGYEHLKMLEWSYDALRSHLSAEAVATLKEGLANLPGIKEYSEKHRPPQRWSFPWMHVEDHLAQPGVVEAIEALLNRVFQ